MLAGQSIAVGTPVTGDESVAIGGRDDGSGFCSCSIEDAAVLNVTLSQEQIAQMRERTISGEQFNQVLSTMNEPPSQGYAATLPTFPLTNNLLQPIFQVDTMGEGSVSFTQEAFAAFSGTVSSTQPGYLIFLTQSDQQWELTIAGTSVPHATVIPRYARGLGGNLSVNVWPINAGLNQTFKLVYQPERYAQLGEIISLAAITTILSAVGLVAVITTHRHASLVRRGHPPSNASRVPDQDKRE